MTGSSTEHVHFVTVSPADATHPRPRQHFECRGDETSPCHQYPDCDCESWKEGHEHPYVPHTDCWMQGWFDNEPGTSYDGDDRYDLEDLGLPPDMDRSGPIKAHFELEYISWDWAA